MTSVALVSVPGSRASALAAELSLEGVTVSAVLAHDDSPSLPDGIDAVVVWADRDALGPALVAACDRAGVRILLLGDADGRVARRYGLSSALPRNASGWQIVTALNTPPADAPAPSAGPPHRVIAVWGPPGSPGRSTVAIQLAVELSRRGRRTALVDADTVAPSLALLLGLSDDAPGIAAACRRADLGVLDGAELSRLSSVLDTSGGEIAVLGGINRPSRWPELSASRLTAALEACRVWTEETVVDVSAALDADDEATHDLGGPRRHGATIAALRAADVVIAVAAADPVGVSRFLRDHADVRRIATDSRVHVVVNQVRPGPLGIDARGQVRRTLERFAGITDPSFIPHDQRAADAALLHARPISEIAPRSPLAAAVRRLAVALIPSSGASVTADSSRGSSRAARRLRRAHAARGA